METNMSGNDRFDERDICSTPEEHARALAADRRAGIGDESTITHECPDCGDVHLRRISAKQEDEP